MPSTRVIKDYVAKLRHPYRYVQIRAASYASEKDFVFFKPGQQWDTYKEAITRLARMTEEMGWEFENSDMITAASFDDLAKQNGWIGDISQKIDFVLTVLGHELQGGAHVGAYGLSPFVVLASPEPSFLPQNTIRSSYVTPN